MVMTWGRRWTGWFGLHHQATFLLLVSLPGKTGIVHQQSGMRNAAMHLAIFGLRRDLAH
ncbi:MAG: hypothetical protein ACYCWC_02475 [Rhodocyclaceae bacterium]